MNKVHFFIVGAPKCGTTALADILSQNPAVHISSPKEPHYFSTDLMTGGYRPSSDEDYERHFFGGEGGLDKVRGDASIWSMYSDVAIRNIYKYNQKAKIVVVLRDPARAAFSLHQQSIYQGQETEIDFYRAWKNSSERFRRIGYKGRCDLDAKLVAYKHVYDFAPQLERIFQTFSPENVLVTRQEDIQDSSGQEIRRVSTFVGAGNYPYVVSRTNESRQIRSKILLNVLRSAPARSTALLIRKIFQVKTLGIGRPAAAFDPKISDFVHQDLAASISAVKEIYGVDLLAPIRKTSSPTSGAA